MEAPANGRGFVCTTRATSGVIPATPPARLPLLDDEHDLEVGGVPWAHGSLTVKLFGKARVNEADQKIPKIIGTPFHGVEQLHVLSSLDDVRVILVTQHGDQFGPERKPLLLHQHHPIVTQHEAPDEKRLLVRQHLTQQLLFFIIRKPASITSLLQQLRGQRLLFLGDRCDALQEGALKEPVEARDHDLVS